MCMNTLYFHVNQNGMFHAKLQEEKPGTTTDEKTTIKVEQGGNFKLNKKDENENTQYYDGAENQLIMTKWG